MPDTSSTIAAMARQNVEDKAPLFQSDEVIAGAAQGRLKSIVERIERLNSDKAAVTADLGEVYAEAKAEGWNVAILRKVVKIRSMDKAKLSEEAELIDLYMSTLEG